MGAGSLLCMEDLAPRIKEIEQKLAHIKEYL
jgi:hypothetical protein